MKTQSTNQQQQQLKNDENNWKKSKKATKKLSQTAKTKERTHPKQECSFLATNL